MKRTFIKELSSVISLSLFPFVAMAAPDVNNPAWQLDIAPYIWAMNMDGSVTDGFFTTHVSESFENLMKKFDGGGMLWLDVYKGPVGAFINGVYSDLSDHGEIDSTDSHIQVHFGMVTYGLSYIILQKEYRFGRAQIEPYAGGRFTFNDVALLDTPDFFHTEGDQSWTDPIIGVRFRNDFNQRWLITLAGDVGEANPHKQYSYNLTGLLGYKPENKQFKNTTVYFGYRYLYQHYEQGKENDFDYFEWNMRLFGPMLGINFNLE